MKLLIAITLLALVFSERAQFDEQMPDVMEEVEEEMKLILDPEVGINDETWQEEYEKILEKYEQSDSNDFIAFLSETSYKKTILEDIREKLPTYLHQNNFDQQYDEKNKNWIIIFDVDGSERHQQGQLNVFTLQVAMEFLENQSIQFFQMRIEQNMELSDAFQIYEPTLAIVDWKKNVIYKFNELEPKKGERHRPVLYSLKFKKILQQYLDTGSVDLPSEQLPDFIQYFIKASEYRKENNELSHARKKYRAMVSRANSQKNSKKRNKLMNEAYQYKAEEKYKKDMFDNIQEEKLEAIKAKQQKAQQWKKSDL